MWKDEAVNASIATHDDNACASLLLVEQHAGRIQDKKICVEGEGREVGAGRVYRRDILVSKFVKRKSPTLHYKVS